MTNQEPRAITRFIPLLQWAPHYEQRWLRPDLIAGLTATALVVPKALGYAGIAGVPIVYGFYAAAAGAILYALFETSRQISTGPSSALAAVAASAILVAGLSGVDDRAKLVAAITFLTGVLFLMSRDIELRLARLKSEVRELLRRDGFIDRLGEDRPYGNVFEAAADQIL